jgi:hypothetical protein
MRGSGGCVTIGIPSTEHLAMNDLNYHIAHLQQQAHAVLLAAHRPGVDDATQKLALEVWRLSNRLSISTETPAT